MEEPSDVSERLNAGAKAIEKSEVIRQKQTPPKSSDLGGATGYDRVFNQTPIKRLLSESECLSGRRDPY